MSKRPLSIELDQAWTPQGRRAAWVFVLGAASCGLGLWLLPASAFRLLLLPFLAAAGSLALLIWWSHPRLDFDPEALDELDLEAHLAPPSATRKEGILLLVAALVLTDAALLSAGFAHISGWEGVFIAAHYLVGVALAVRGAEGMARAAGY